MEKYKVEMLETLKKYISFNSITDESTSSETSPFGKVNRECLDFIMNVANDLGFKTKVNNGYYGYAEIGEGEELILILSHLDIVPSGDLNKWNTDPFTLTEKDGFLYGRGVNDDKGPGIASLYAVKSLMDENTLFNKRVRLLFGCNEETGFKCVEKYVECEELPTYGFTPDSHFPLCHGEKGIMRLDFKADLCAGVLDFAGGMAVNAVADSAKITFGSKKEKFIEGLDALNNPDVTYELTDKMIITAKGKSSHAANPEQGDNAIVKLMNTLNTLGVCAPAVKEFNNLFTKSNGEDLGIKMNDEFGSLTMNVGTIKLVNNELIIGVDVRYPITKSKDEVISGIDNALANSVYSYTVLEHKEGIYFSLESDLVKSIMDAYIKVTNDTNTKPYTMGGGTYARSMPNIVAIGGSFPGEDSKAHEPNECISIDSFYKQAEIHKQIILNLLSL